MTNIAIALKSEIARIARKEIRTETEDFKKASSQYRTHIAALRKRIDQLERQLKKTSKIAGAQLRLRPAKGEAPTAEESTTRRRFSSARLQATRKKLDLSRDDFGKLVGVSGQSIYLWEKGETRPRANQLEAIAAVRSMGKREAAARLEALAQMR